MFGALEWAVGVVLRYVMEAFGYFFSRINEITSEKPEEVSQKEKKGTH